MYISKFLIKDIDFHPDISLQNLNHMFTTTDELFSIVPTNDLVIGATTLVSVSSTTSYEVKKVSYRGNNIEKNLLISRSSKSSYTEL